MNRALIKHRLVDHQLYLIDLARKTEIPYDRLVRIVNGYRKARTEELEAIAAALDVPIESIVNA